MNYIPTIGLEVHAELKTVTKMFCDSLNNPNEKHPNVNVCPVCLSHPGTLPVINKKAVESVLRIGMAVSGDIPMLSKFDRKNYFYPDIPKGYQISQYDLPLVFGGVLRGVRLTRIHLEEDTGRLVHVANSEEQRANSKSRGDNSSDLTSGHDYSLVDYNRAGVPLMELVTEPDIVNAEEAMAFAKELQLLLRYLDISDADMDKGQMRIEANVSIRKRQSANGEAQELGTKVEVKNINSFRAVYDAIQYEIKRQTEVVQSGKKVIQETRGWDDVNKVTVHQRLKESSHDYRYFPEPDLPPLDLSRFDLGGLKRSLPELPTMKRARFASQYKLNPQDIEALVVDRFAAEFFEEAVSELEAEEQESRVGQIKLIFNYLTSDLRGLMAERNISFRESKVTPEHFAHLIQLISSDAVSSRTAKDMLVKMLETGIDPHALLHDGGLRQVSDYGELGIIADKILGEQPAAVSDYKKGKENALQFLVGKAMAELKGKGNPGVLQKLFKDKLAGL